MSTTDAVLIQRWARDRDSEAFRELVQRYAGMVFSTSRRILGNTADAEDVTQECFLNLCQLRQPGQNVAAWLHRVATHRAIDAMRSRSRRRAAEKRWEAPAAASDELKWQDIEPRVDGAIEALPENVRIPLVLYYLRDQTQEAIAKSLGVNQATVSHRVRKGVETIRKQLQRRGLGLAPAVLSGWLSTQTIEATPGPLLARLGKLAILGHDVDRVRRATAPSKPTVRSNTEVTKTSLMKGWPMKTAAASIAGLVVVGSLALFVFTPSSSPESVPRELTKAPVEVPNTEPVPETHDAPLEIPRRDETPPPSPVKASAVLGGTIRNEIEEPIAFADVYLAMNPPRDEDILGRLASFFRADYFMRSRFLQTKTDSEGRYLFEGVREFGDARLGAFKENYSDPRTVGSRALTTVKIEEGAALADIDLVMAEGKTLTGRIFTTDGSPVADAVVSVYSAWTPTDHIFWPAGLGPTDASGRFQLGFEARAAGCHLRVNSANHGQAFFLEVPVTDDDVELTLKESAQVEGTITWGDGTPASGLTVRVNGRLPEPPIPISRMGIRPYVVHDGVVGENGTYIIEGLHPQLTYDIFIIDGSLGEQEARKKPLTPRMRNSFRLDAGERKVWDHAVSRPITIRGRIRTETSGTPLPEGQVGVRKDGKRLALLSIWADREGFFEKRLNTGPGEYRVHAEPPVGFPTSEEVADLIDARFGQTLHLSSSEEVEVDLTIFEPVVLPIRVLDHTGEPVKSIRGRLHVTFPNGHKMRHETSSTLDDTGRTSFSLYYPATEFWYEISAHRNGPTAATRRYVSNPGTVLPEETIVLPRTCQLIAALIDSSGKPHKERWVHLRVIYEDGSKQNLTSRTDKQGILNEKGRVQAAAFVVELRAANSRVMWKSGRLDASAEEVLDLGEIVLDGEDD